MSTNATGDCATISWSGNESSSSPAVKAVKLSWTGIFPRSSRLPLCNRSNSRPEGVSCYVEETHERGILYTAYHHGGSVTDSLRACYNQWPRYDTCPDFPQWSARGFLAR